MSESEPKLTTAIRTTLEPGKVIEVEPSELLELNHRGLIASRETDDDWEPAPADDEAAEVKTDDVQGGAVDAVPKVAKPDKPEADKKGAEK